MPANYTRLLNYIGLILVIFLGLALRIFDLDKNPPELFTDELINVVSAKSVVETGVDLDGKNIFYFSDRVELRPPIYGYSAYLSTKIFGDSAFSIRLPAVIFGLSAILLLNFLTFEFTNSYLAALFASLTLAVSPWYIHYSRIGWEPASFLPFLLASILLFLKSQKNILFLPFSFMFFGLLIYTYQAGIFYSILFLLFLLYLYYPLLLKNKNKFLFSCLIYFIVLLPFIINFVTNQNFFLERASRISTFKSGLNYFSMRTFFSNYLSHFSFKFLFTNGDPNLRHGAQTGVLYGWSIPFLLFGLLNINKIKEKKHKYLLFVWLLLFPIGGSLTNDGVPHATRTLIGAPILSILTSAGITLTLGLFKKKSLKLFFLFILFLTIFYSVIQFSEKYFLTYPKISASWWQYGHKEVFTFIKEGQKNYLRACLGNLDYWGNKQLIEYYLPQTKLQIIDDLQNPDCNLPKTIIVSKNSDLPVEANFRKNIYNPMGNKIYVIYTID